MPGCRFMESYISTAIPTSPFMNLLYRSNFSPIDGANYVIPVAKTPDLTATLKSISRAYQLPETPLTEDFKGDFKECLIMYPASGGKVILLGMGDKKSASTVLGAFRFAGFKHKTLFGKSLALDFLHTNLENRTELIDLAVNGLLLGGYKIGLYKTAKSDTPAPESIPELLTIFSTADPAKVSAAVEKGVAAAAVQAKIMDLVNAAPNKKTPVILGEAALRSGGHYGYSVKVMDRAQCETEGLHAFLSVNDGSAEAPAFIILEYKPAAAIVGLPKIGLAGKGVTFDTGGVNIKPSANLWLMKSDMGGAGAVMGAVELAARLQLPVQIYAAIPCTENVTDGKSTKPGSVINSFAGKTIEVIDTDAEGRLVLADAVAYTVKHFSPDVLIDLATLTGSIVSTLGYNAAGLFCNNDAVRDLLLEAGDAVGERLWAMPLWDVYGDDMRSDVADIANLSSKPVAGAITAAKFIETFVGPDTPWAHIDIAGVALANTELGSQRTATAYGVRVLVEFMERYAASVKAPTMKAAEG